MEFLGVVMPFLTGVMSTKTYHGHDQNKSVTSSSHHGRDGGKKDHHAPCHGHDDLSANNILDRTGLF